RRGRWKYAAADYHSRTPDLGQSYASRVMKHWHTLMTNMVRKQRGVEYAAAYTTQDTTSHIKGNWQNKDPYRQGGIQGSANALFRAEQQAQGFTYQFDGQAEPVQPAAPAQPQNIVLSSRDHPDLIQDQGSGQEEVAAYLAAMK